MHSRRSGDQASEEARGRGQVRRDEEGSPGFVAHQVEAQHPAGEHHACDGHSGVRVALHHQSEEVQAVQHSGELQVSSLSPGTTTSALVPQTNTRTTPWS